MIKTLCDMHMTLVGLFLPHYAVSLIRFFETLVVFVLYTVVSVVFLLVFQFILDT